VYGPWVPELYLQLRSTSTAHTHARLILLLAAVDSQGRLLKALDALSVADAAAK
jgi:hypothetical protein